MKITKILSYAKVSLIVGGVYVDGYQARVGNTSAGAPTPGSFNSVSAGSQNIRNLNSSVPPNTYFRDATGTDSGPPPGYNEAQGEETPANTLVPRQPQAGEYNYQHREVTPPEDVLESGTVLPEGVSFGGATGAFGFIKNTINKVFGSLSSGVVFKNNSKASKALNSLKKRTMVALAKDVSGKPSQYLLEELESLTLTPNSVFAGEDVARLRLRQMLAVLDGSISENSRVIESRVTPHIKANAAQIIEKLRDLKKDYEFVLDNYTEGSRGGRGGTLESGAMWRPVD